MTLEGGEVNVRNEKDRLRLEVCHHLEDGHIIAFLEDGYFDVHNCERKRHTGGEFLEFLSLHLYIFMAT